jgi:hypothetical protein
MLTGVCAWMTGLFAGKAQGEVFGADPDPIVCGSGSPLGRSTKAEGRGRLLTFAISLSPGTPAEPGVLSPKHRPLHVPGRG